MSRTYNYPVWGTQGGGLVREVNGTYIFVEKPNCSGLDVGDEMPEEWGLIPANGHARQDVDNAEDEYPDCPKCPDGGRVGLSAVGGKFYCYECCGTF